MQSNCNVIDYIWNWPQVWMLDILCNLNNKVKIKIVCFLHLTKCLNMYYKLLLIFLGHFFYLENSNFCLYQPSFSIPNLKKKALPTFGKWRVVCRKQTHFKDGLTGLLERQSIINNKYQVFLHIKLFIHWKACTKSEHVNFSNLNYNYGWQTRQTLKEKKYTTIYKSMNKTNTQPGIWTTSQMAQMSDKGIIFLKCVNRQTDSKKYLQFPLQCPHSSWTISRKKLITFYQSLIHDLNFEINIFIQNQLKCLHQYCTFLHPQIFGL